MTWFNMKRILLLLLLAFTVCCNYAQVIEWAIKPVYQDIVPIGKDIFKVKANNSKWGVYNVSKGLLTVNAEYDSITAVVEDRALLLDKNGMFLYGIISDDGSPVIFCQLLNSQILLLLQSFRISETACLQ